MYVHDLLPIRYLLDIELVYFLLQPLYVPVLFQDPLQMLTALVLNDFIQPIFRVFDSIFKVSFTLIAC